ncbi:MAG: TIGR03792 family protein [Limnothrix sp. RL_2_0]|nr:TIGR03792 family protein [Limnothrix sp. RL_2_0]
MIDTCITKEMFNSGQKIIGLLLLLGCLWLNWTDAAIATFAPSPDAPVVEYLQYSVPTAEQAFFVAQEEAIWGQFNAQFPGFDGKEIWQDPSHPERLIVVVHWQSRGQMQSVPKAEIHATNQAFEQALGKTYPLTIQEFYELSPVPAEALNN